MKVSGQEENAEGCEPGISDISDNGSGIATASESQSVAIEGFNSGEPGASEGNESLPARRATGPRSPEGKQRSKHNALKHGLFSKIVVLEGESRPEFDALLNGLRNDRQPVGELEEVLVEKLATLFWRQRRLIIADGQANIANRTDLLGWNEDPHRDHLLRYETTLDRAIDRVLAQFERIQRIRKGQTVLPLIDVNISSS